jgi:hypothetical protein
LKETTETVQDEALKKGLEQLKTAHDSLATPLAAANPTAVTAAQVIVSKTFEVTKKPN